MFYLLNSFVSVLSSILYIGIALLIFAILIAIHELGHYIAGKIFKFKINEFSIGFGKAIYKKTAKSGEIFSIRIVPLGGYCAFEGEDKDDISIEGSFNSQAWWKRLIVLLSGVLFNFVSACLVAVALLMILGNAIPNVTNFATDTINHVEGDETTLQSGDVILLVEGKKPTYLNGGIYLLTQKQEDKIYTLTVDRQGERIEIEVQNIERADENGDSFWALDFGYSNVKYGFFESLIMAVPFCVEMAIECLGILWDLIIGNYGLKDLGGPITTVKSIAKVSSVSLLYLLLYFPLIAVNLAVFNLLPLPALDGGRMVFVLIEGVRGKPINRKLEEKIHTIGIMLLFAFVVLVDLLQLFVYRIV